MTFGKFIGGGCKPKWHMEKLTGIFLCRNLKPEDQSAVISERFEQNWELEMKKKK
jgi:hypothetical protein